MLSLTHPAALLALVALPVLWWLLRHLPPPPRRLFYPAAAVLTGEEVATRQSERPPRWLIVLRLLLASLLILAAAGPRWRTGEDVVMAEGQGAGQPRLLLVIDNGFPAAEDWHRRMTALERLVEGWPPDARIHVVTTAPAPGRPLAIADAFAHPFSPTDARRHLNLLAPQPFLPQRDVLAEQLRAEQTKGQLPHLTRILWVTDGFLWPGTEALRAALAALGPVTIIGLPQPVGPFALQAVHRSPTGYRVTVVRPADQRETEITAQLVRQDGLVLAAADLRFAAGARKAEAELTPGAFANRQAAAVRLILPGEASAAHVYPLDRTSQWHRIGILAGPGDSARPFVSPAYYLARALRDAGEVVVGGWERIAAQAPDVVIVADRPVLEDAEQDRLRRFVEAGGVLLRFAGPRYENRHDSLHPVPLARGARLVGGDLSWERPQGIAAFPAGSPLAGLTIPPDVKISGQVLALPGAQEARVLARLTDGTPLVTARALGRGLVVFVHTSADPSWSNLALSPIFPRFLDALLATTTADARPKERVMSGGLDGDAALVPELVLTGRGRLVAAPPGVEALPAGERLTRPIGWAAPAGFYRAPDGRRLLRPLQGIPGGIGPDFVFQPLAGEYADIAALAAGRLALWPALLVGAVLLLALERLLLSWSAVAAAWAWVRRKRVGVHAGRTIGVVVLLAAFLMPGSALTQTRPADPARMIAAVSEPRLAYVCTGQRDRDERILAGLEGLTRILRLRTAAALGRPMGVTLAGDLPLALFPLVYWAPPTDRPALTVAERSRLRRYIRAGGILFIDLAGGDDRQADLQRLLGDDALLPQLVPLDNRHILARSFYLLDWFPGRRDGQVVWVSADSLGKDPRVSPVVIGAHDWAGAWAIGAQGRFLVPELPGGIEQREFAFRFGINLVMYALAGTYKGDQIHLPAILERLRR